MIPRYRAWDTIHKTMYEDDDIVDIDLMESQIHVKTPLIQLLYSYSVSSTQKDPDIASRSNQSLILLYHKGIIYENSRTATEN